MAVWPWTLTPLTSRVLGAASLGIAGLGALADRRWSSARILLQVAVLMLTLILIAGLRATSEFDPSNAMKWLIACGFGGVRSPAERTPIATRQAKAQPGDWSVPTLGITWVFVSAHEGHATASGLSSLH